MIGRPERGGEQEKRLIDAWNVRSMKTNREQHEREGKET